MNIAIILAGGNGSRLGSDIPKQYIEVAGRPIISYCLGIFESIKRIDAIQIVADSCWHDFITAYYPIQDLDDKADKKSGMLPGKLRGFSKPGANRQLSIVSALSDVRKYAQDKDCVIIHDAARACISENLLVRGLDAIEGHDGVMPVLPMKDTVYYSEDGKSVTSLLNRSRIFAGQAPEFFHLGSYERANNALLPDKIKEINGSTEPAMLAGLDIVMIDGEESNYKITTKEDLERFKRAIGD